MSDDKIAESIEHWKNELKCALNPVPLLETIARSKKFARVDRNTRDANGDLIRFGAAYKSTFTGDEVQAVGLDLRGNGRDVMCWSNKNERYVFFSGDKLIPNDKG